MAEVRLENVHKRIGSAEIIPDLTVTIRDGELFTVVGPSGSGKSTVLHLIAGLDAPTGGRILFDGHDVTALEPRERDVAMVFQSYALYPHMTVAENLAFPLRVGPRTAGMDRARIRREVQRVAGLLGLDSLLERRPRELSGGQRQRVALGRAIIRRPQVFLLDEPLSNLDMQLRTSMRAELRRLHDELRTTMIYVTHDQMEAMTLADRVAVLDRGRLQQVGAPQDLYDRPGNVFVAEFIGHPSMNILEARVEDKQAVAGVIRVPLRSGVGDLPSGGKVKLGLRPEEIRIETLDRFGPDRAAAEGIAVGKLRLIEPAGSQVWVTCEFEVPRRAAVRETMMIVGLAERGFKGRPGDRVAVSVCDATPHLFDTESGARLGS